MQNGVLLQCSAALLFRHLLLGAVELDLTVRATKRVLFSAVFVERRRVSGYSYIVERVPLNRRNETGQLAFVNLTPETC